MNPAEWRINDIERTANEAKRRLYQIDELRNDLSNTQVELRDALLRLNNATERIGQLEYTIQHLIETGAIKP